MKTRLLARLLLVTGSTLPALLAGCGDDTSDDGTAQTSQNAGGSQGAGNGGSAGSGAGSGGASAGNGGTAGSSAGSGGSDAGAGGSDAGAGGSDAGAGGTAGAGGSDAGSGGSGGSAAGNGGAGGNICVEIEVCKDGQITKVCADPLADPKPFTDCGNGTCVDVDTMCPGPGGAGGSDAGAGGSDAGSGGSDGGSGGMAGAGGSGMAGAGGSSAGAGGSNAGAAGEAGAGGSAAGTGGAAGSGGSGGSPGVPCKEGGACVEDAWCGDSDLGQVLHCQKGTYAKSDPGFADVKVCIERAPGEPCLEDGAIELQPAITAEYNASCLGVQGAAEPPVQKASNGVERCCYQVFAVCVGRPLFLGVEMRIAALLGGGGWA